MKILKKLVVILMVFVLSFSGFGVLKAAYAQDENQRLAVSLVIDTSGSMKNTDPDNMRETASKIFIDLLNAEDSIGIISFNTEVTEIQPMTRVGQRKNEMKSNLTDKLVEDGHTDYLKGFQAAKDQLAAAEDQEARKVILFITDGSPDPDPDRIDDEEFMNNYQNEFWDTVKDIGEEGYSVYTVGIGALDLEVIDRIALETRGRSRVFKDPSEIAKEFFHITAELKNRDIFTSKQIDIKEESVISFESGIHTLQTTFVITHDFSDLSVSVETPQGRSDSEFVHVERNEKYTLVTVEEPDEENTGQWKLTIEGNGKAEVFGAKDQAVKVWVNKPLSGYRYPVGEALEISAEITGVEDDDVTVEGVISLNGKENEKVILSKADGTYIGEFTDTTLAGEYLLTLSAIKNGEEISRSSSTFILKSLPVMKPDLSDGNMKMNTNVSKIITSTLEVGANTLKLSEDLSLEYFNLVGETEGKVMVFPMVDDGNPSIGDAKAGDGRFSTMMNFDQTGQVNLYLEARGLYQGELFILEESLGDISVYAEGTVSVKVVSDKLTGFKGKDLNLDLALKSESFFDEVIHLSVPEEMGVVFPSEILLGALEEKIISVTFLPNKDMNFKEYNFPLAVSVKNENTNLSVENTDVSVTVISQVSKVKSFTQSYGQEIIMSISIILIVIFLYVTIGLFFYLVYVKKRIYLQGTLFYTCEGSDQTEEADLARFRKRKIILELGNKSENKSETTIHLGQSSYRYNLVIENQSDYGKSKILSGYRSIFKKKENELFIRTTEPGIIMIGKEIHTRIRLIHKTEFKSGDYFFRYEYNGDKNLSTKHEGRNLLEGRLW